MEPKVTKQQRQLVYLLIQEIKKKKVLLFLSTTYNELTDIFEYSEIYSININQLIGQGSINFCGCLGAARSKAWVCGRSISGIAGSNSAGDMYICLLWVLCVVR